MKCKPVEIEVKYDHGIILNHHHSIGILLLLSFRTLFKDLGCLVLTFGVKGIRVPFLGLSRVSTGKGHDLFLDF
jgi:hypothetical protein